ncbi:MAG: hypothetical protein PHU61_03510 [Candidatus Absconditabacteria bacterium]|nr:hypothetical protein [Candidatus Absconditabacteria bacterium]MDD3868392.1 hypothetical protein [Candidatus Absconditabacteria bacterium]
MALIALPAQIFKNWKEKKVGIHWTLVILAGVVYCSRGLFALTNENGIIWYTLVSDTIGTASSLILIFQSWKYRKKRGCCYENERQIYNLLFV